MQRSRRRGKVRGKVSQRVRDSVERSGDQPPKLRVTLPQKWARRRSQTFQELLAYYIKHTNNQVDKQIRNK